MPKTNHGGASAAGMQGIVEHGAPLADGRTRSELDPERNLDGTLIEGEHPDHADAERRNTEGLPVTDPEPQPVDEARDENEPQTPEDSDAAKRPASERQTFPSAESTDQPEDSEDGKDSGTVKPIKSARASRVK